MGNMSGIEHARRNLVCTSWHKAPEEWQSWSGMSGGYTRRPFCRLEAGHTGDHEAWIETIEQYPQETQVHHLEVPKDHPLFDVTTIEIMTRPKEQLMTWPNTLGIPEWLLRTTRHGMAMMQARGILDDEVTSLTGHG